VPKPRYDCIVVGGGPAGAVAAVYLARFRRQVLIVESGESRARWIPRTRNVPAYPAGLGGTDLLARLGEQVARYDVARVSARVTSIRGERDAFTLRGQGGSWQARTVLVATGVSDILPTDLAIIRPLIAAGRVRLCAVCDAYEVRGKRIAVLSRGAHGVREARFLSAYSRDVTLLTHGASHLDAALSRALREASVKVHEARLLGLKPAGKGLALELDDGSALEVDALYVGLGVRVHSGIAGALGARRDGAGYLRVAAAQQTSVRGIYAAGDVVQSLSQISVAFGQAAIAASAINASLGRR
jgi:thioredoxin reductase (NADPH)